MAQEGSRRRTYRYRLHPTELRSQALLRQLNFNAKMYNAALEERIGAWNWERRSVSYLTNVELSQA